METTSPKAMFGIVLAAGLFVEKKEKKTEAVVLSFITKEQRRNARRREKKTRAKMSGYEKDGYPAAHIAAADGSGAEYF